MGQEDDNRSSRDAELHASSTLMPEETQLGGKVAEVSGDNAKWDYSRGGGGGITSSSGSDVEAWQKAIEKTVKSVVSVRFSQPYSFDTSLCHTSEATGFVIDSQNG